MHYKGGKAFVLPGVIDDLAGVFPAVSRLTCRNPEHCVSVMKRSLDIWILRDPAVIFLPLYRKSQRTVHGAAKDCNISQNSGDVFDLLNERRRDYYKEKMSL